MHKLGLIGTPLIHSFSKKYFDAKFETENIIDFQYALYDLADIKHINAIYENELIGLNVTLPYKKKIIQYLDKVDIIAQDTQSVNTIFINQKTKEKIGFNTDAFGFEQLLAHLPFKHENKSLILGSGGVSNTVAYVLKKHAIEYKIVSREPQKNMISYTEIKNIIRDFKLIINTTPLGQYPNITTHPKLPYHLISNKHQCIDLIYNPKETVFLKKTKSQGAQTIGGEKMFISQAEASWSIWNNMMSQNNV